MLSLFLLSLLSFYCYHRFCDYDDDEDDDDDDDDDGDGDDNDDDDDDDDDDDSDDDDDDWRPILVLMHICTCLNKNQYI